MNMKRKVILTYHVEICCDYCCEPIHTHIDCPICGEKYSPTDCYDDITLRKNEPFRCMNCGTKFKILKCIGFHKVEAEVIETAEKS